MPSVSTTYRSSRRNVHRECPDGGVVHAKAITLASTSPVTFASTGGLTRFLRVITSPTRPPHRVNCRATSYTVPSETPARSATTRRSGAGPSVSSSANNTRARAIIRAGCVPLDTTRVSFARSPAANQTMCSFGRGIATPSSPVSTRTANHQYPLL